MTGKELIKYILDNNLEDKTVYVGCQGYVNSYNFDDETRISVIGQAIVLHDDCYYDLENI